MGSGLLFRRKIYIACFTQTCSSRKTVIPAGVEVSLNMLNHCNLGHARRMIKKPLLAETYLALLDLASACNSVLPIISACRIASLAKRYRSNFDDVY